ncbi:MAG: SRPBCC family protein [Acidobacteria bacterium]|nr:SRPBCC family protein [Acidobacteriota bacterium]
MNKVRSQLGGAVSYPSSIEVTVNQGAVTFSGPILAHEVDKLLSRVRKVRGVKDVKNRLEVHERPDNVPGLQGGVERRGDQFELLQTHWSPTARLLVGAAGGALTYLGAKRRDPLGIALGTVGTGMLLRGLTNLEVERLIGLGAGRRAVELQKTINIAAPVERVYEFWSNFENFPRFMTNVREVRVSSGGQSHWVVEGPAGVPVEWDAGITKQQPNRLLAWKSVPGSVIQHAGIVRFDPDNGGTRLDIKMSYNPPAGAVGHSLATLFGSDPKSMMDEDLMRMKTMIETGTPPHDAAERERGKTYIRRRTFTESNHSNNYGHGSAKTKN